MKQLKVPLPWLMIVAMALAACAPAATATLTTAPTQAPATQVSPTAVPEPRTLTVLAAASLTDAFTELGSMFEAANPGVTVAFNFAGSNALAQQINEGAEADVFASANRSQMNVVISGTRVISGSEQVFVRNRLVVIFPSDNPGAIESLEDLANEGLSIVLAAPEVPVGQYALDFVDKAVASGDFGVTYKDEVLANVVSYEDNVRAVFTKVALGEADAGIVYSSDVVGEGSDDVNKLDIPDELNTLATYPIAALVDAPQPELAAAFIEFVLLAEGQAVLGEFGFITVQ